ncbi:MAG: T9SS type A sorting domain-containing protein [Bacteroidia bacterium]|nr:T9SS type A sorting domain-containing protein [Bacteroidia bacterium]
MKLILISTFLGISQYLNAQEVVSSGGDFHKTPSGSVSYTIGEPVIETYTNSSNVLTQGFNQTKLTVTEVSTLNNLNIEVSAYPNPTQEFVIIKTSSFVDLNYEVFDSKGRIIIMNDINESETSIKFNTVSTGIYFIKLFKYDKEIKTFKIEKQ